MTPNEPDAAMDAQPPPDQGDASVQTQPLADAVAEVGEAVAAVDILISYEVVRLLSEQLYASPVKAVEELVVNGWDAGATSCSVLVDIDGLETIAVFDDGCGMNQEQLTNLWHIGISHKAPLETPRKQIGKFGIGKLASYAVATRATYVSKTEAGILSVSINFDDLVSLTDPTTGIARPLPLSILRLPDSASLTSLPQFGRVASKLVLPDLDESPSWTLVVLEQLRERATALTATGRLRWVLETAMPYANDFTLHLNDELIESNKRDYPKIVEFNVGDISDQRLKELNDKASDPWVRNGEALTSASFPNGVRGTVVVTKNSLYKAGGKSEDLGRSHGFFVRVHKRLVNETDPLFGARPLSFSTWYHFAAEIEADDLNPYITASRDDFEQSDLKPKLRNLLIALFNEARDLKKKLDDDEDRKNKQKIETERESVSRRLMEQSLADALSASHGQESNRSGDDHQDSAGLSEEDFANAWTHLESNIDDDQIADLIAGYYDDAAPRRRYKVRYAPLGETSPFVLMNAIDAVVTLNEDHALVQEHSESPDGRRALETFSFAEVMLESYMREAGIELEVVRELLSKRDLLLSSLAQDEAHSLQAIARSLRDNARNSADSKALEISVVGALRALGFAATHVSGSKTPDGTAGYQVYGSEDQRIIIEAKATAEGSPSLNHMDLAGVTSHAVAVGAVGAILVAPSYPGAEDPDSETSLRAKQQKVSCWTAEQLALVVERAERRHINARDIEGIVLSEFAPADVKRAVEALLNTPAYDRRALYRAILDALAALDGLLTDMPRTLQVIASQIVVRPEFAQVKFKDVAEATIDLAHVSRGLLHVTEESSVVVLLGDLAELRRRATPLTELSEGPRRHGTFRSYGNGNFVEGNDES